MRMGHAMPRGRAVRMLTRAAVLMTGGLALLGNAGLTWAATPDATTGLGGYYTKLKSGDPALCPNTPRQVG